MAGYRTLRGALGTDVRQPDLGGAPKVSSLSGFGTGGGAYIRNNGSGADQSQGLVIIRCGLLPASSGTLVLAFGATISAGQYWAAADWAQPLALSPSGANLTINWTASRPLLSNEMLALAYQWSVST